MFVFSPGDVVAPLGADVIGDMNCEEDTEMRQQEPQVNGNQPPGIWSFMMLWDTKPNNRQAGYWVKKGGLKHMLRSNYLT